MSKFIQLHVLTSYPPSNLNRDDLGRPKTAKMGGVERLRVSSQSLKRAWRTSDLLKTAVSQQVGIRTKRYGETVFDKLTKGGISESKAKKWAADIAGVFGSNTKDNPLLIEQLCHISNEEEQKVDELIAKLIDENRAPNGDDLKLLQEDMQTTDIALFGRMLASSPMHNVEAACQVSHALSVHPVIIEDDFFTAVDDLNNGSEGDAGAAHIGEAGFAAGLFYLYVCIDKSLLVENLKDNEELANKTIKGLIETIAKVGPSGKQNSFGSRAYATYIRGELGEQQPRSLSVAFLKPVFGDDIAKAAIDSMEKHIKQQTKVYGKSYNVHAEINALPDADSVSLDELIATVCE